MTDRELLALAAGAAGRKIVGDVDALIVQPGDAAGGFIIRNRHGGDSMWNPLTVNGDAFELAVDAEICVEFSHCSDDAPVIYCGIAGERRDWPMTANFPDPYKATRRAIVEAAAKLYQEYLAATSPPLEGEAG